MKTRLETFSNPFSPYAHHVNSHIDMHQIEAASQTLFSCYSMDGAFRDTCYSQTLRRVAIRLLHEVSTRDSTAGASDMWDIEE